MSTPMSQAQKERMEENRRKALELRAAKLKQQQQQQPSQPSTSKPSSHTAQSFKTSNYTSKQANPPGFISKTSNTSSSNFSSNGHKNFYSSPSRQSSTSFEGRSQSFDSLNVKKGSLMLISRERFELVMDYHQPTIEAIKAIPGREYDSIKRNWNFPLSQYEKVVSVLKKMQPTVVVGELFPLVVETFVKRKNPYPSDVDLSPINSSMRSTLMDFQVESVKFAVSRAGRVLIADDMGLGKTIQALAIADYYHSEWPLLIVCPSSMRFQWVAEIHKHLKNVDPDTILVITNGKDVLDSYSQVVITSYDLMTTFKDKILAKKFGVVIMDESHHLKNPKAKRTQAAIDILAKCKRCVLLSGTPVLSRPVELHCQLDCIKPKLFKFMDFALRYCDAKKNKFGWDFSGSKNMTELSILLKEILMIRRLKSDVLSQLPPKRREVVMLENSGKKLSDTSEFAKILDDEGLKGISKQSTLMSYFQETAAAKMKGVMQYIQDMIDNGEKFLVFAHHAKMLDAICSAVESKKTDYIRIDGSVHSDVRKELCNHFQEQENCLVAVLSIKAANTGLTLTAASLVIFAELYWNPGDLIQAEDRAHRIGQADSVLVQYLVQRGTADDKIWPLVKDKLDLLNAAGLAQDEFKVEETVQAKSNNSSTGEKNITDYFLDDDDAALAELDLGELENSFEIPQKRSRIE